MSTEEIHVTNRKTWLPEIGTRGYYVLLAGVAVVLGILGGVTAAFMNFSLGFFVGGQVLAGILGSAVTYGYGAEGKHGANYMQTMAASVASMAGMACLIQAMAWMGIEMPSIPVLMLYFLCIGMFGVGVGMLYTPILVDRMQLTFPSGFAVANILRALTDKRLLKRSIGQLTTGTGIGFLGGILTSDLAKLSSLQSLGLSGETLGAGMIVGARIAFPALVVGVIGEELVPYLNEIGWLEAGAPFRKIGFVIALGMILGAAMVDLTLIGVKTFRNLRERHGAPADQGPDWKRVNTSRLVLWIGFWAAALVAVAVGLLDLPPLYVLMAVGLVFVFLIVNGISLGISDSNPISSAFVVTVFLLAGFGLLSAQIGLMCAAILLIACAVGGDMQQDRSTGWRLGTNRVIQFRFQMLGIVMGAVAAVGFWALFSSAYPELKGDQTTMSKEERPDRWQSAMTYKLVGALDAFIGRETSAEGVDPAVAKQAEEKREKKKQQQTNALLIGLGIGLVTEVLRKLLKGWNAYKRFRDGGKLGFATDFAVDAVFLPSPYASSFGGFVDFTTSFYWAMGGVFSSYAQTVQEDAVSNAPKAEVLSDVPEDMSSTSLVGGGLIAGASLAALTIGVVQLVSTL
jgi:hypothetical protein